VENVSNLACYGAAPICLVNCLNFASPVHPTIYWQLEQCTRGLGDMARTLKIPVVGGNVSLYNESDEFGTQIKPTPSIGVAGKGDLLPLCTPSDGDELALIGKSDLVFGGSVLDAISGCGGAAPAVADPSILPAIRSMVEKGRVQGITDLSHGGLLAALGALAPHATVSLGEEMFAGLFAESYGRFLLAFRNESQLTALPYQIIGEVGGEILKIRGSEGELILSSQELQEWENSITRLMRHAWQ
jgi:phosphoribosylformylglycinamidine (FGAM) synthase-like enzyme